MVVNLKNYCDEKKILVLAKSDEAKKILSDKGTAFFCVGNEKIIIYPEKKQIVIDNETEKKINNSDDFDVFYVSEIGWCYKYYDNENEDNAFMLTSKCNSNCIMCPASDKMRSCEDGITIDDVLEIVRVMPNDPKHITITGGEPFLIGERIFEIFDLMKSKFADTSFLFLTNGRALCYMPFAEKLKETIPEKTLIGIPLHGYDPNTHDYITRAPGSFEQTLNGLKNILRYKLNVELRIVVSKLNCDYISSIAELIIKQLPSVSHVTIMAIETLGNAAKNIDEVWIPYQEAFMASKEAIDMLIAASIDVNLFNFPLCAVDKKYHYICRKSITDYKIRFAAMCDNCKLKEDCGGVFASSFRLAQKDMKPVM